MFQEQFWDDPLMSAKDVASYCAVSRSTVDSWRRKGILKATYINSDARYRRSQVNALIQGYSNKG